MYGAAPSAWVASTFDFQWKQALSEFINPSLLFQFKLQRLQSQANMAVIENGCDKASVDQKRAFTIILKIFDKQIKDMEDENPWIEGNNLSQWASSMLTFESRPKQILRSNGPSTSNWASSFQTIRRNRALRPHANLRHGMFGDHTPTQMRQHSPPHLGLPRSRIWHCDARGLNALAAFEEQFRAIHRRKRREGPSA